MTINGTMQGFGGNRAAADRGASGDGATARWASQLIPADAPKGLTLERTNIDGVVVVTPVRHGDARGFFTEIYNKSLLEQAGITAGFVQDNYSLSAQRGVIRGLHYQTVPWAQAKLVRVMRGRIFDVVVDIRRRSPTFGRFVTVELSASTGNQIFIPEGFAHGFCTLEPNTEVLYKVSNYYKPSHDCGIIWSDPELGIPWPVAGEPIVSERDQRHPLLRNAENLF